MTIRAVIYARHSTDMQDKSSVGQIARCEKLCSQKGYRVETVYTDEGISGALIINRPGIISMLEACRNGEFDRVICEDLSRLSRSMGEMSHIHQTLSFHEVTIETPVDGEVTQLHVGMRGIINDIFRADLSDKTMRGKKQSVQQHGRIPVSRIFGYRRIKALDSEGNAIKGIFEIDYEEAKIVKRIYNMFLEGKTFWSISETLTAEKILSPRGTSKWSYVAIRGAEPKSFGILNQPLYVGTWIYNKTERHKNPETGRIHYKPRPQSEWITINLPHLTILDKDVFEAAQIKLKEDKERRVKRQSYLDSLSPERIAKRESRRSAENRRIARKNKPRQYRLYIFSRKILCEFHNSYLKAVRVGCYSCEHKGCTAHRLSWKNLTFACLKALKLKTEDEFISAAETLKIEAQLIKKQIADLRQKEKGLRQKISMFLEILDIKHLKSGTQSAVSLNTLEEECAEIKAKIEELLEIKDTSITYQSAKAAYKKFLKAIKTLEKTPEMQEPTRKLHESISEIKLKTSMNLKTLKTTFAADITLNYREVFTEFGPLK